MLAQRFLIEHLAGSGGMGRVYRASDQRTGQRVAVKVLASNEVEIERFRREAALLSELVHPRIVRYVAHGEVPSGEAYLAMEWLEGEDLAARLSRGPIGAADGLRVATQVAEVLGAAHAKGVVHRDVKPANLFLIEGRLDDVRVIDFGIALVADGRRMTRTGVALGTLGYMAPEQVRGDRAIDARADIFALGCVLFECLTGKPPFLGEIGMSILARILLEEAPRASEIAPGIPPALDDLVARMLAKDPADRPRDGRALVEALAELDDAGGSALRAPARPALGRLEQRVLCVLLVAPEPDESADERASADTVDVAATDASLHELSSIATAYGAELALLADRTLVMTLSGHGAATDHAARAARCALALRTALPRAQMALCTGRCEVGVRAPTGEVIDRAAGILRAVAARDVVAGPVSRRAPPAPIHVDDVTTALLDARFATRQGPLGAELAGERELFDTARTLLGKRTPFVGRDRELDALLAMVAEARDEGEARAALVTAPPGYGKSRLRRELVRRLRMRGEPVEVWMGRGDPMRSGAPFGILADAVKSAAGFDDAEPIESQRRKIEERARRVLDDVDAQRVAAFLGEIAGAPFPTSVELAAARSDATLMADQMSRALRDLLAAECAQETVLFVLEDLHWGDHASVKLVDATLRSLSDRPFVVLALARPEVVDTFPKLWAERAIQHVRLGDLPRRSGARLARQVLGDAAPEATIDRLLALAAGNVLYLEELLRAEASGRGAALPETVLAMVQSRLASLDDEARRALRAASVFGAEFRVAGAATLLGRPHDDVAARFDDLCERELFERRGSSRVDAHFTFRHELLREAAYASLTPADRALGHRIAGTWLEENGERDAMVLAEHAERGGEIGHAARWYRRAAEQALLARDVGAAMDRAARGIACGAAGEDLGMLRYVESQAHEWRGETALAAARALEALSLLPERSARWLRAAGQLIVIRSRLGLAGEAAAWAERLREQQPEDGETAIALALALAAAAAQLVVTGHVDVADRALAHVLDRCVPLAPDAPLLRARLDRARGLRLMYDGDVGGTLDAFRASAQAYAAIGDHRHATMQELNAALALLELGSDEEAGVIIARCTAAAERTALDVCLPFAHRSMSRVLLLRGELTEARALAERAMSGFHAQGHVAYVGSSRQYLAEILAECGDLEGALRELDVALVEVESSHAVYLEVLGAQAEVLLRAGRVAEAVATAREGTERLTAEGGGMAERESRLRLTLVDALDASGDVDGAARALRDAAESLERRARPIGDPALRRSFLGRVRENARIVALAKARLGLAID